MIEMVEKMCNLMSCEFSALLCSKGVSYKWSDFN